MLMGTVEYNTLAGSSPVFSHSLRDVAEWQTRLQCKMHLVLWAGSDRSSTSALHAESRGALPRRSTMPCNCNSSKSGSNPESMGANPVGAIICIVLLLMVRANRFEYNIFRSK